MRRPDPRRARAADQPGFDPGDLFPRATGDFPPDLSYGNLCILPRRGQIGINAARVIRVDGTDVRDLTRAELEGRRKVLHPVRFFQRYVPGCEESTLLNMAPRIGVRATRRIRGHALMTGEDVRAARVFPDAIAQGIRPAWPPAWRPAPPTTRRTSMFGSCKPDSPSRGR